jgi:hypothetical protein
MKMLAIPVSLLILFSLTFEKAASQDSEEPLFTAEIGVQTYSFRNIFPEKGV